MLLFVLDERTGVNLCHPDWLITRIYFLDIDESCSAKNRAKLFSKFVNSLCEAMALQRRACSTIPLREGPVRRELELAQLSAIIRIIKIIKIIKISYIMNNLFSSFCVAESHVPKKTHQGGV